MGVKGDFRSGSCVHICYSFEGALPFIGQFTMEKISDWFRRLSGEISLTHDPQSLLDAVMRGSVT